MVAVIMQSKSIDISLVSGRRPGLLKQTLESFDSAVFRNFDISRVYANIDPFAGSESDHLICRELILQTFPQAVLSEPERPNLGQAVKTLWSQVQADYVLHLEDDWLALQPVTPEQVFPLFDEHRVRAVSFAIVGVEAKGREKPRYLLREARVKVLGIKLHRRIVPFFSTSPSFYDGQFARQCAKLMDPHLDPEKQFLPGRNPKLSDFCSPYLMRVLYGQEQCGIMKDIGRSWRSERGIKKLLIHGQSVWHRESP